MEVGLEGAAQHDLTARRLPLHALTGIRFFAAYYVVVFHSRVAEMLRERHLVALANFFGNGFLAVSLFFLLSGFILAYTYAGQIERKGDHRRFWEARFARIWPVYALSLLLASVPSLKFPPWPKALAALLMVQAWNPFDPELAGIWNPVCWTLSVEALFYLVFPWLQVWLERRGRRAQLGWVAAMLAVCLATNSGSRTLFYLATGVYRYLPYPILHLPEFFVGVGLGNLFLLARRSSRGAEPMVPGRGAWTYGSAMLTFALLCCAPGRWSSAVIVAFALLLYGLAAESTALSRLLSTPLSLLGGGISYSVYLMQMPVKRWVILAADDLHIASTNFRLALTFVVLTLVSLILFRTVEDPARRLLRGWFARLEERRSQKFVRETRTR